MKLHPELPDLELEAWRREWQAETAVSVDLRKRVERQSRIMRIFLAIEVLITIVIGGAYTGWAVRSPQPDIIVLAVAVWVFCAAAWTFVIRNRRGTWSPAAMDTSAFLDLSIRRSRARIAASGFAVALYAVELLFCLAWVYHYRSQRTALTLSVFLTSGPVVAVWACTLAFVACVLWYRRRRKRELAYLLDLQRQLNCGA